ncbi:hypothetical protein ACKS0A_01859 [Histoplasma ohiense]
MPFVLVMLSFALTCQPPLSISSAGERKSPPPPLVPSHLLVTPLSSLSLCSNLSTFDLAKRLGTLLEPR